MRLHKTLSTSALVLLSIALAAQFTLAASPTAFKIEGVPRIKQATNFCGPAALASVLQYHGEKITQQDVGKAVFDSADRATNGADMLLYVRNKGYAAYSWNSGVADAKRKIAAGAPVLALQHNSLTDASGHYRVLTGYDDAQSKFYVMDPYYDDITELSYAQCERLWKPMGYWGLLIVPAAKDAFASELGARNPVVHMDLSFALYKQKDYTGALKEAQLALTLEPGNSYTISLLTKINRAMGAGGKP
jgi:ABC-type bacteriocin/lantibiotic exporter with double-glycine peptidase domain